MKRTMVKLFAGILLTSTGIALADVHYVDVNSTNATPPYTNWSTAATNIQDAVDAAVAGDEIVVTNGIYATGVRNGNRVTVDKPLNLRSVNGPESTSIMGGALGPRCVSLTNGAVLSGFTLSHGRAVVGGGASGGTLNNCIVTSNSAAFFNNAAGGGAYGCTLNNCTLSWNSAYYSGGGAQFCTLNNCTLIYNSASGSQYGTYAGGAYQCTLNNSIVYHNTAQVFGWVLGEDDCYSCWLSYCCAPAELITYNYYIQSFTNAPLLLDEAGRLQSNSPCINAGNNSYATNATDLDGNPRIIGGTVDIGAYEFQSPTSIISYAWLEQYGLPTDGSADFTDPDGDGMNNWQEWRCGTDPTNALSALRMLAPRPAGTNVIVTWQSVAGISYFLERSTNLTASPAFVTLATGIEGQAGTTTFVDSNAGGAGPFFYRVGVNSP